MSPETKASREVKATSDVKVTTWTRPPGASLHVDMLACVVATLHEALSIALATRSEVRLAYLFGSAVRGELRPESDVDVAVLLTYRLDLAGEDALRAWLEAAAGRPVDLVSLDTAPPLLLREIIATGVPLLTRDEDERARFEARAIARYLDTAHLRRVQHDYLRARIEGRG